jgi:hypothetical protein
MTLTTRPTTPWSSPSRTTSFDLRRVIALQCGYSQLVPRWFLPVEVVSRLPGYSHAAGPTVLVLVVEVAGHRTPRGQVSLHRLLVVSAYCGHCGPVMPSHRFVREALCDDVQPGHEAVPDSPDGSSEDSIASSASRRRASSIMAAPCGWLYALGVGQRLGSSRNLLPVSGGRGWPW